MLEIYNEQIRDLLDVNDTAEVEKKRKTATFGSDASAGKKHEGNTKYGAEKIVTKETVCC